MGKHKKSKKHKEKKHKHKKKHSSSSSEDEWVEKEVRNDAKNEETVKSSPVAQREEWMNITSLAGLYSHKDRRKETEEARRNDKEANKYDPKTSIRELNPYWKHGDGLPSAKFMKPTDDNHKYDSRARSSNWRKKSARNEDNSPQTDVKSYVSIREEATSSRTSDIIYESKDLSPKRSSEYMSDKEMNELGAKIVKAEILGNAERVAELKEKLENARRYRSDNPQIDDADDVLLTRTDAKGFSKPVHELKYEDTNKRKKQTINTHDLGKRQKYYPDDGKYSLQNMFENEKFGSADRQEEEFMKAASKLSRSDDLDDMFMDNIRTKDSDEKLSKREREKAIQEHKKISQSLDNCRFCIQSTSMLKHLMVSLGETVYLSLPPYEPLTEGHCLLLPIRHVTCSTQLDENEWSEIQQFRKSLTNMYKTANKTVIFYETASNLHHYPHMVIHCVPMPDEQGDMAPVYFKKAIDECEMEWSTNKKLINMAGKDVRKSVPKGLPFFWVSFNMKEGFAHVIEEQKYFPKYFAEEIIGGILDLHHSKWRKSVAQKFEEQKCRVLEFSKNWSKFDCTNQRL